MRVLILGGTAFLGIHLTSALRDRGHEVTHFNRGRRGPPPDGVRSVRGDRTSAFEGLERDGFDAVVDTSGYLPGDVERAVEFFATRTERYVFVSSVSVYDSATERIVESSPMLSMPAGGPETEVTAETYGPLKAACERIVEGRFAARATILRPGLIVGPHDPTDRFTYWPLRFARGGDVLAPGEPQRPIQFVDARDVAEFAVTLLERDTPGDFNVVSQPGRFTMGRLLETCAKTAGTSSRVHWVADARLLELGVAPWTDLPLWIPPEDQTRGFFNHDVGKALAAGLAIRALDDTVADTLDWALSFRPPSTAKAGITPERERTLLERLD